MGGPAHATPVRVTYKIYTGGVNAIDVDLNVDLKQKSYTADLTARTRGFLGKLVPWQGRFESQGIRTGKKLQALSHESISTWRGKDDRAVYTYDRAGKFKSLKLTDDGIDKSPDKIDSTLTVGTMDILTATLDMLISSQESKTCSGAYPIFDSRRRFILKYSPVKSDVLKKSRYNIYDGLAQKCTVEVQPDGGAWHKKPRGWLSIQEQGRKKGDLPTIWIGSVRSDLPPMPVKIMIKTDYGTMFMHLVSISK